jgi:H/ACA ribonucleoprotein complex subunit 4
MNLLPFEKIKREVFVKRKADTSEKYGCKPEDRPTEFLLNYGVININKPKGPTSHQVSAYVQKILNLKKAGHSGTLDPKVTGVLPVAIGNATRIVEALLTAGKEYIAIMHLHKEVKEEELIKVIQDFVGKIKQLPPIKSSVKREWRFRKVYYIDILEVSGQDVMMRIGCQAGTYIRKLLHDIGQKLKVGAHMAELIRTKAGPFNENTYTTLQDLADAYWYYKNENNEKLIRKVIQPVENAIQHLPKIWVLDSTVDTLCHGVDLKIPGIAKVESDIQIDENMAILTLKNELIATGKVKMISKDIIKNDKGIAVKIERVFMQPGTYPKMEK